MDGIGLTALQNSKVQLNVVKHCVALCSAIQCSEAQCSVAQFSAVLHGALLHGMLQRNILKKISALREGLKKKD